MSHRWRKYHKYLWGIAALGMLIIGAGLLSGCVDTLLLQAGSFLAGKGIQQRWTGYLRAAGWLCIAGAILTGVIAGLILPNRKKIILWTWKADKAILRWVERISGVSVEGDRPFEEKGLTWTVVDYLILGAFALFALLYSLAQVQGNMPYTRLTGDAANIASFAAGQDDPLAFAGDMLLGNPVGYTYYRALQVPIVRLVAKVVGDYGLATLLLLPIHVFFYLWGYYLLFLKIAGSRFWALLYAAANIGYFVIGAIDFWGIHSNPLPRFTFSAALPYLILLFLRWRHTPRLWWLVMAITGLLASVYVLSAVVWAGIFLLSFIFYIPGSWHSARKFLFIIGLLGVFCVVPLVLYAGFPRISPDNRANVQDIVIYILQHYLPDNQMNVGGFLAQFLPVIWNEWLVGLSLVGGFILWFIRPKRREVVGILIFWIISVSVISLGIPWLERQIERFMHITPVEFELMRSIRYLIPLLLLLPLWGLCTLQQVIIKKPVRVVVMFAGLLLVTAWLIRHPPEGKFSRISACWIQGRVICTQETDYFRLIEAVKKVDRTGTCFFTIPPLLEIRYVAKRPLVYFYKDRAGLIYSNPSKLKVWLETYEEVDRILQEDNPAVRTEKSIRVARGLKASHLIMYANLDLGVVASLDAQVIHQNRTYLLIDLRTTDACP
ncbi:MAG TPA: hypothetical protein VIO61_05630 [Anaerolineaceae bacterium]